MGGKGGQIYVVTDSSDRDPANPVPGTLRHAVIQDEPLWIVFAADMTINLKHELIFNSFKTVDGRGANIHVTGHGCITLQYVSNIIIHNIHVHHCTPSGNTNIRASPTHVGWRGRSDGDGISIFSSRKIWIDHCSLSYCTDGLIDAIMGSTAITISNNHFAHHDEVMLLGHNDKYSPDRGMQVTIAFNHFGEGLVQRMPRCRLGYIHVVNNDFTQWQMYAIGGSANPTINSQGNRYTAPSDPDAKEVHLIKNFFFFIYYLTLFTFLHYYIIINNLIPLQYWYWEWEWTVAYHRNNNVMCVPTVFVSLFLHFLWLLFGTNICLLKEYCIRVGGAWGDFVNNERKELRVWCLFEMAGDEARGHRRQRVERVELENGRGHNGKWSIFCTIWCGAQCTVRRSHQCATQIRRANWPAHHVFRCIRWSQVLILLFIISPLPFNFFIIFIIFIIIFSFAYYYYYYYSLLEWIL